MRILLFGKNGQVGNALTQSLAGLGQVIALGRAPEDGLSGDFLDLKALSATVRQVKPDLIINAAAYTAVDQAEREADLAFLINAHAPAILAEEAARLGAWLVHYSSDYVFDGSGDQPWQEFDQPAPLSVYGKSKWAGDEAVAAYAKHLILRTSWVYGTTGGNFIRTILRLAAERNPLKIVHDQWGTPTFATWLAAITSEIVQVLPNSPKKAGTYHATAQGFTNWRNYAAYLLKTAHDLGQPLKTFAEEDIVGIASADYPTPAIRPKNSRLSTEKLKKAFGITPPTWQEGVQTAVKSIVLERQQ